MENQFSFHLKGDLNIKLSEHSTQLLSDFILSLIEVEKVDASNIMVENFHLAGGLKIQLA